MQKALPGHAKKHGQFKRCRIAIVTRLGPEFSRIIASCTIVSSR